MSLVTRCTPVHRGEDPRARSCLPLWVLAGSPWTGLAISEPTPTQGHENRPHAEGWCTVQVGSPGPRGSDQCKALCVS